MKDKYIVTHYLPLVSVIIVGVIGIVVFSYDRALKMSLTVAVGASYFVWGLIHHYLHHELSVEIVLEYLIICVFGVTSILTLIN